MIAVLKITDLTVSVNKKKVLKSVNLAIGKGEVHAIMGPNGSGKSTLAYALMGHPFYEVGKSSRAYLFGKNILNKEPFARAQMGLFLAFQNPLTITGLRISNFLKSIAPQEDLAKGTLIEFYRHIEKLTEEVGLDKSFLNRYVNDGFSGGEKKKLELLQLLVRKPKVVIVDEIDTGLDIDSLREVATKLDNFRKKPALTAILIISHYQRIFNYIQPDHVHILIQGQLVKSGNRSLVEKVEKEGYAKITR